MRFPSEEDLQEAVRRARSKFKQTDFTEPHVGDLEAQSVRFVGLVHHSLMDIVEEKPNAV